MPSHPPVDRPTGDRPVAVTSPLRFARVGQQVGELKRLDRLVDGIPTAIGLVGDVVRSGILIPTLWGYHFDFLLKPRSVRNPIGFQPPCGGQQVIDI